VSGATPVARGSAGVRRAFAATVVACLALLSSAVAQGISFTVQVIAVSDQANAIDISRGLLRDGFPAYVVRSTGGQGDVYRVRVGAFANRVAAARYAAAMPSIGGARPVPALAEAIPAGIMPLAPRVLWQSPVAGADLRVAPWPGDGLALRRQAVDPLRQATYDLVQGGEVRTLQAWRLAPLAALPVTVDLLEVPFVDLTVEEDEPDPATGETAAADADEAPAASVPPGPGAPAPGEAPAAGAEAPSAGSAAAPAAEVVADVAVPVWADPAGATLEAGLLLLRDRSLWPATWVDDGEEVRAAFRTATISLVANRVGLAADDVELHAYFPGGGPPPALVAVELSDRSGRDLGDVRGLADPRGGLRPEGPPPASGSDDIWWPVGGIGERVRLDVAAAEAVGGATWTLTSDGGFVRIATADGADWRAVAGVPLWSDGRYALVRDGDDVVLVDFLPR